MTKRALCVGINDYPDSGNDLSGCVNDALGWRDLLMSNGYAVTVLLDADATRERVVEQLRNLVSQSRFGDRIVFTYSGHGSWVPDRNGDERDQRDECLVLYDWQARGYLTDDDLWQIWSQRRFGVRVTTFSDSCFSGTVNRFVGPYVTPDHADLFIRNERPRYFPAHLLTPNMGWEPKRRGDTFSRTGTVLFSGCDDLEVSYDAYIDGRYQGAFSAMAFAAFQGGTTMRAWYERIRDLLPSKDYPQTPQLQASAWQRRWTL